MKIKKLVSLAIATTLLATSLTGCSTYTDSNSGIKPSTSAGASASQTPEEKATEFTFAGNQVVTLNPILSQSSNDDDIFYLLQAGLLRFYQDEILYDVAESYDVSKDNTQFTFHLRDAVWSDGEKITAEQFAYTLFCYLSPDKGSPKASDLYEIKNSQAFNEGTITDWEEVGVKALDEKTLQITLEKPSVTFIERIAYEGIYPLRKEFVEAQGDNLGSSVDTMLYCGPYVLKEWVLNSSMTFEKNPKYWDTENSFPMETVKSLIVEDANTKVAMFENGEIDAIQTVSSQYYDYLKDSLKIQTSGGVFFLWFNQKGMTEDAKKVLSNQNFRKALSYAIDREATMKAVDSVQIPTVRAVESSFPGSKDGSYVEEYTIDAAPVSGDVEKAKEYFQVALEELGYTSAAELPEINYVTWDATIQKTLAETIIDQWKQNLGITSIKLNQYVIGTAIGNYMSNAYDIFAIGISSGVTHTDLLDDFVVGGDYNLGIWESAEYDQLIAKAKQTEDVAERLQIVQQAEQILSDASVIVPLYGQSSAYAVKPNVKNFYLASIGNGIQINHLEMTK